MKNKLLVGQISHFIKWPTSKERGSFSGRGCGESSAVRKQRNDRNKRKLMNKLSINGIVFHLPFNVSNSWTSLSSRDTEFTNHSTRLPPPHLPHHWPTSTVTSETTGITFTFAAGCRLVESRWIVTAWQKIGLCIANILQVSAQSNDYSVLGYLNKTTRIQRLCQAEFRPVQSPDVDVGWVPYSESIKGQFPVFRHLHTLKREVLFECESCGKYCNIPCPQFPPNCDGRCCWTAGAATYYNSLCIVTTRHEKRTLCVVFTQASMSPHPVSNKSARWSGDK